MDQEFVEVSRAGAVESVHRGTAVAVNADGDVIQAWGDETRKVFPRSSMKPIQSLVMAETGLSLSSEQWALSGASHDGEDMHIHRVSDWLAAMGLGEGDLICGPAWPAHGKSRKAMVQRGEEKSRLIHNCSGKHCGHLATCQHMGWDVAGYDRLDHPFQERMIARFSELVGEDPTVIGVDGCSLPAPQVSLKGFADSLAQIADMVRQGHEAAETVYSAFVKHPQLTGGSTAFNAAITEAGEGAFFAKTGAEGMFSVIIPEKSVALAIKASDGSSRASQMIVAGTLAATLDALGMDHGPLKKFLNEDLHNAAGLPVGHVRFVG